MTKGLTDIPPLVIHNNSFPKAQTLSRQAYLHPYCLWLLCIIGIYFPKNVLIEIIYSNELIFSIAHFDYIGLTRVWEDLVVIICSRGIRV